MKRQQVDDHAEVAALLDDGPTMPAPRQADQPWSDSSPTNLLDAVGPVEPVDSATARRALLTVAEHATDRADLVELAFALGLHHTLAVADITRPEKTAPALAGPLEVDEPEAKHVHDPFVVWHLDGTAYAMCEPCGTTWERQPCEACGSYLAALHIARTGRSRHSNHPEPK